MKDLLPFPSTKTVLRRLAASDLPAFQRYRHDPDVGRYQGWKPQNDFDSLAFLSQMSAATFPPSGEWIQLGISENGSAALIGDIGIFVDGGDVSAEIGFTVSPAFQGRGLASDAVSAAIRLIFAATKVPRVIANTDERNVPSIKLLERVGMQRISVQPAEYRGEACVEITYEIEREC